MLKELLNNPTYKDIKSKGIRIVLSLLTGIFTVSVSSTGKKRKFKSYNLAFYKALQFYNIELGN